MTPETKGHTFEQSSTAIRAYPLDDWSFLLAGGDKIVASEWDAGGPVLPRDDGQ